MLAVLQARAGQYLSAEEVTEAARLAGESVGRTTVYRTLEALTQEGLVRRFVSDKSLPAAYEYLSDSQEVEYHVRCCRCKKLFHLRCSEIDRMTAALSAHLMQEHGVELDLQGSVIQGMCSECKAAAERDGGQGPVDSKSSKPGAS